MESRICAVTIDERLVPIQHEVVDVTHLAVCRDKPVFRYFRALMNPNKNRGVLISLEVLSTINTFSFENPYILK